VGLAGGYLEDEMKTRKMFEDGGDLGEDLGGLGRWLGRLRVTRGAVECETRGGISPKGALSFSCLLQAIYI